MTPQPPIPGERGPERERYPAEPEAPTIEPNPAPEPVPAEPEPDDQREGKDKPGIDEYDEERLPPEPVDPSEGN
ncbi:MAG TPA: hypothetical protein VE078_09980 [Thermoanaerobaculia bacterium]|nr:hypothetical protein [Thermoanaerobaculia bacterium]